MPKKNAPKSPNARSLPDSTAPFRTAQGDTTLTTNQGVPIADNQNSLKAGVRGPSLLEDFILREKITHFDHERIPERIVHARGSAAHGFFEVQKDISHLTCAKFLRGIGKRTPIFARFSTVQGGSSSADTVRDVRGFAVKFYTEEGNYDLVGNNIPVFFIQDAIKFPDLVHAVKPEPHFHIPQGQSAHDNFWDFVSLVPETTHMLLWIMSDRAIPRSLRMMQGFGVNTYRLVDDDGRAVHVKFHFKPKLGAYSLLWDETQTLTGKDPDFHRRDLWDAIESGNFPEWDFFVQVFDDKQEKSLGVDLLDPTKLVPEEVVPLTHVGRMVLDRNPDNFFAETEQAAFHPGHVVPGIDFSEDPLLQGRIFSYLDTQLSRLGGPNFHEIPINQPRCPMHNLQRDGMHRQQIVKGRVNYEPSSLGGCPMQSPEGFKSFARRVEGTKVRERSPTFADHYSQATMFFQSQSEVEKAHIVDAFAFELSKVETIAVRERVVQRLTNVDMSLATQVGGKLGLDAKALAKRPEPETTAPPSKKRVKPILDRAPSLSMESLKSHSIATRKIALVLCEDASDADATELERALAKEGVTTKRITGENDVRPGAVRISTESSVAYDAVAVIGGEKGASALFAQAPARMFVRQAFDHLKTIAAPRGTFERLGFDAAAPGLVPVGKGFARAFIDEMRQHKHWDREP